MLARFCLLVLIFGTGSVVKAQNLQLVWADEFDGTTIDPSVWQYEAGPSNDNVQFYTDRTHNAKLLDGKLQIIALKESYQGYRIYFSPHPDRTGPKLEVWPYGGKH